MKVASSRTSKKKREAYHTAKLGRATVAVYKRTAPKGEPCFMVSNYAEGKRRFDCYADETEAIEAANRLVRQISERDVLTASMTREQAIEYASAMQTLQPLNLALVPSITTLAEAVKLVGDLSAVIPALKFYVARHKRTVAKRVAVVVAELLKIKEGRGASERYKQDLKYRLNRFAEKFQRDTCNVTTAEIQAWLDEQKLSAQGYTNFRRVLSLFFKFAVARGYASDNPLEGVERVKVRSGETEIFTPSEIHRLLAAASDDFLPCVALGAFAGLRSAEIERMEWSDLHLAEKHIVVGASRSKTAGRRIVPIHDNLAAWLTPYALRQGKIWRGTHKGFYDAQRETAAATEVKADMEKSIPAHKPVRWKANALRHSYASYRFAQIGDAGRVAGELGNSAAVVHRHYRELVKSSEAEKWFSVKPEMPANVATFGAVAMH